MSTHSEAIREAVATIRQQGRRPWKPPTPEQIKHLRAVTLGLTQEEFAATYGISVQTLRNWEHGKFQPDSFAALFLRVLEEKPDETHRTVSGLLAFENAD